VEILPWKEAIVITVTLENTEGIKFLFFLHVSIAAHSLRDQLT